ncbi:MAG: T9SS C-terminal target domain-containing protein [Caldilineae bacterium]|nr:MAG: T9SS C-terminal target domain-containing protein [Caldilineae bacterium]
MRDAEARSWRGRRATSPLLRLVSPSAVPDDPVRGVQVYPTPFRSQTTIRYWLDGQAHIRLELYDVLGRRVQRIVDEEQAGGVHDVQVSGEGLPPGTYFYRMEAGRRVYTGTLQRLR